MNVPVLKRAILSLTHTNTQSEKGKSAAALSLLTKSCVCHSDFVEKVFSLLRFACRLAEVTVTLFTVACQC